jgi:alkanesulfonate monooxygenase SsuD/methylene tetrahydromethanopterin reductase-like flavin-dependent oxidoreductase (luciferase family)
MDKLQAYGETYGRPIDSREAGVLLLTHVCDDKEKGWETVAPFLRGLPMAPEDIAQRCVIGPVEECVEKIQDFVNAGCVKFVLRPACSLEEIRPQIEHYGKDILPHFVS